MPSNILELLHCWKLRNRRLFEIASSKYFCKKILIYEISFGLGYCIIPNFELESDRFDLLFKL
jgi:hypothetical protein